MDSNKDINFIITGTREYAIAHIRELMEKPPVAKTLRILQQAEIHENCNQHRITVLEPLARGIQKLSKALQPAPDSNIVDAEVVSDDSAIMLSGPAASPLSPCEASDAADVGKLREGFRCHAQRTKCYTRGRTASMVMSGLYLRLLRVHFFGPRNPNGGRPKRSLIVPGCTTWEAMLAEDGMISDRVAKNWMKCSEAVEALAIKQNLDIRSICEKLPWDWTPEENSAVDQVVGVLTEDKTQRELLQSDFLSDLGYTEPARINSSNNPLGINGGKRKFPISPAEARKQREETARFRLTGSIEPGKIPAEGLIGRMFLIINDGGKMLDELPKQELQYTYDQYIMPFSALVRKIINNKK